MAQRKHSCFKPSRPRFESRLNRNFFSMTFQAQCSKNSQLLLHSESFLHNVTQTCQGDIPGIDVVVQQVGVRVVVDVGEVIPDGRKEVALAAVLVPEC